jgi:hypothetical protein
MQPSQVTVRQALVRAMWMIMLPSMTLLLMPLVIVLVAVGTKIISDQGAEGSLWFGPALLISFLGGWLAWSIQVPKWRLWSYERVENVQELKARAVAAQLIWPDSSIFTRTEIATRETWKRIRQLEAAKSVPAPPNTSL